MTDYCVSCGAEWPCAQAEDAGHRLWRRDLIPCAACDGRGEIGVRQDYFGNWETEQCRCCAGMPEVTPARAAEWAALEEAS